MSMIIFVDLDGCYDLETGERCETPKSNIASVENFYRIPGELNHNAIFNLNNALYVTF